MSTSDLPNYNEIDLTLAFQLQEQFKEELLIEQEKEAAKIKSLKISGYKWAPSFQNLPEPEHEKLSVSLVDPCWELLDPNPNIYDLFLTYNSQFFWGRLLGIEVKWSPRMTLCAGICSYEGRGGLCSVRLSMPLLKLRPRKDLVETLLHEMIHAYLFITDNNRDHDGHGPQFHKHMYRINKLAGTNISVFHTFHDEVRAYQQHVWHCNGPCQNQPPYFGYVKRSMNRAPAPNDFWWNEHAQRCGGIFAKIKEPKGFADKKGKSKTSQKPLGLKTKDIRSFFPGSGLKKMKTSTNFSEKENQNSTQDSSNRAGFSGIIKGASNTKATPAFKSIGDGSSNYTNFEGSARDTNCFQKLSSGTVTVVEKPVKALNKTVNGDFSKRKEMGTIPFSGKGYALGATDAVSSANSNTSTRSNFSICSARADVEVMKVISVRTEGGSISEADPELTPNEIDLFPCPVCNNKFHEDEINFHVNDHFSR